MPYHSEQLDKGLVVSREETLLQPGELTKAEECYYKPSSPTIYPVPGHTVFNTAALVDPVGIALVKNFESTESALDSPTDYIFAHANGTLYFATVGLTGTFATNVLFELSVTIQQGISFEALQLGDTIVFLNGVNRPIEFGSPLGAFPSGVEVVPAGYLPLTTTPTVALIAGTWLGTAGTYWYWITEFQERFGTESGFTSVPASIVVSLTDNVRINRPSVTPTNTGATHWRIYRSVASTTNPFPVGFLIAELSFSTATFDDSGEEDFTDPYPVIEITVSGEDFVLERNGTPPVASMGDIFENSIITDDMNNIGLMRYTFSDSPRSWPDSYFINFERRQRERLTRITRLGSIVIAATDQRLYRVNYLPREGDAEFDRGRVYDIIAPNVGIVGRRAATFITLDGDEPVLAFVARSGLFYTNGYRFYSLDIDLDWSTLVSPDHVDDIVLIDVPHLFILVMFYTPFGGTSNTKALFFHYHSSHRKEAGNVKVTGPISISAMDAVYIASEQLNQPTVFTLQPSGIVYREESAAPPLPMLLQTRRILAERPEGVISALRFYVRHRAGPTAAEASLQTIDQQIGEAPTPDPPRSFTPDFNGFSQLDSPRSVQSYALGFESEAPLEYWIAQLESYDT